MRGELHDSRVTKVACPCALRGRFLHTVANMCLRQGSALKLTDRQDTMALAHALIRDEIALHGEVARAGAMLISGLRSRIRAEAAVGLHSTFSPKVVGTGGHHKNELFWRIGTPGERSIPMLENP